MDSKTGLPLDLAGQQHLDDNLQARKRRKKSLESFVDACVL